MISAVSGSTPAPLGTTFATASDVNPKPPGIAAVTGTRERPVRESLAITLTSAENEEADHQLVAAQVGVDAPGPSRPRP